MFYDYQHLKVGRIHMSESDSGATCCGLRPGRQKHEYNTWQESETEYDPREFQIKNASVMFDLATINGRI